MAFFDYREGRLCAEDVPISKIAELVDTPVYCYSASALRQNYRSYAEQFKPESSLICNAVKANSNQAVIKALGDMGADADVVSEGELNLLNEVAMAEGKQAPVAFRINPDIDARTHHKITTGKACSKFGIP